ncbi:unnamed protein product, partial [Rotaria magnacalcarata]
YYDENVTNYVAIHPEDDMFSQAKQVKILSKHDAFEFEVILKSTVTPGAIALNHFQQARQDQQNFGSNSALHIIVFDEIDAVCKNRAQSNSLRNNVHDNVTAQLLAEIDGMIYLGNILLIGTTNILESIDPALLRPGRIEKVIKVELPNAAVKQPLSNIHIPFVLTVQSALI